jgi:hypothetical protein
MEEESGNENLKYSLNVALRNSFLLALSFAGLFALATVAGFARITELRFINYFITFIVCYHALETVFAHGKFADIYFTGMRLVIFTATLGQLWFSILLFIYLNINGSFANYLLSQMPWDIVMPKFSIALLLFAEGFGVSVIIGLMLIQLFEWKHSIR